MKVQKMRPEPGGVAVLLAAVLGFAGCGWETFSTTASDPGDPGGSPVSAGGTGLQDPQEVSPAPAEESYRARFSNWMESASKAGMSTADAAGQWVTDSWNGLYESGAGSAAGAAQWTQQTWQTLRDAGLTRSESARQWLLDEYNRPLAWEYDSLELAASEPSDSLIARMNQKGRERWECFAVLPGRENTVRLLFRRHPKSLLPQLPLTDTLKLLNAIGPEQSR